MGEVMTGAKAERDLGGSPGRGDIDEAERLCALAEEHDAKATPGPYVVDPGTIGDGKWPSACRFVDDDGRTRSAADRMVEADARFFAEARLSWPKLAKATRGLIADLAQARGDLAATQKELQGTVAENEGLREELEVHRRLVGGRADALGAAKEALKLLQALTEHEDGPWRPEIVRLHEALMAAGEIERGML